MTRELSGGKARGWVALLAVLALAAGAAACGDGSDEAAAWRGSDFDRGPLTDRQQIYDTFNAIRTAFFDGDATAVCDRFDDGNAYSVFLPSRCRRQVERVAEEVSDGTIRWPRYRVRWIRTYGRMGGLTVYARGPGLVRLAFREDDGEWKAAFEVPRRLEGLNVQ